MIGTGTEYIKVTKAGEFRVFSLCSTTKQPCELLGGRSLNDSELKNLRKKLTLQTGASSIVSLLGLACAATGIVGGVAGADIAGAGMGITFFVGSVGGTILAITSKYNPVSLYERMESVHEDVIEDNNVTLDGGNAEIEAIASSLDEALRSI